MGESGSRRPQLGDVSSQHLGLSVISIFQYLWHASSPDITSYPQLTRILDTMHCLGRYVVKDPTPSDTLLP